MRQKSARSNGASGPYLVTSFDQELPEELTNVLVSELSRRLLDRLTPNGWLCAGLDLLDRLAAGDFLSLRDYDPDVLDLHAGDQYIIRQCRAFFEKRKDIGTADDRRAVALRKFWDAERACTITNACFRAWGQGRFQFRPVVERVLHTAQRKISQLLGDVPTFAEIRPRFGPGATTQVKKQNACSAVKLKDTPACSSNFTAPEKALAGLYTGEGEAESFVEMEIHHARLSFVPKNAKTDRAICTEPTLNGMYQLGLGEHMARLLKQVGIDLKDQSANQRAALYGSLSGASATLDLSSASDTVALGLVEHLLPPDWYDLLCELRSAVVIVEGTPYHMEKISSMGNGFTFPLETIVFWAIAQSAVEVYAPKTRIRTLVYGDDIVVDQRAAVPLMSILRDLGFTPNPDKSFWTGNFRESCGKDYVFGTDVRPVYIGGPLTGADLFRLHNFFWAKGLHDLATQLEEWIHPSIRLYGPHGLGDGHLSSDQWNATPRNPDRGWEGVTFETWTHRPKRLRRDIADRLASRVKIPVKHRWDEKRGFVETPETRSTVEFHGRHEFLVRRLATYTQYLRENRPLTLTKSDAERSKGMHVYRDRRMPDPINTPLDEDIFIVPGTGQVVRTKVYILKPAA